MPACGSVIVVVFLVTLGAVAAHLFTVIWVDFTDFDWFPFFVAAVDSFRYWSVDFDVFIRVFT